DFTYLTAKAKINYNDGEKDISGIANIRMGKDSAIWISLSPGLGIEVARIYINPDSVYFVDRINKTYMEKSFEQISRDFDFDITFHLVESVLLGNLTYPYKRESVKVESNGLTYQQQFNNFVLNNFIGKETHKLERMVITDTKTQNMIRVNYGEFRSLGEEIFPYLIQASVEYMSGEKQKTNIEIGFNKAQLEEKPLKFPFSVPDRYQSF
ncbi:MAG: DUF4292 domain-containing protein, partial [Cyclobacteriaceae bacterium]|nr:DUF4292 domain-containing protein [Cyclobacteriaceae bacterium]